MLPETPQYFKNSLLKHTGAWQAICSRFSGNHRYQHEMSTRSTRTSVYLFDKTNNKNEIALHPARRARCWPARTRPPAKIPIFKYNLLYCLVVSQGAGGRCRVEGEEGRASDCGVAVRGHPRAGEGGVGRGWGWQRGWGSTGSERVVGSKCSKLCRCKRWSPR